MDLTQVGYFIMCFIGGAFIIAVPWSSVFVLILRRDRKKA
jgi:hypothetical protein